MMKDKKRELVEETLLVTGLDCPDCALKVGAALRKIQGVVEADVNFAASTLTITYDSSLTNRDRVVASVEDFGYEVTHPQRSKVSTFLLSGVD